VQAERVRQAADVPCEWQLRSVPIRLPTGETILLNSTHLGCAQPFEPLPIDCDTVEQGCSAVDVTINPRLTPFLRLAQARGSRVVDGVEMLVQLAMQMFSCWTGIAAIESVFQRAVLEALSRNGGEGSS
jgi:shikimate dehydrogenase